jgi:hypothetical protein
VEAVLRIFDLRFAIFDTGEGGPCHEREVVELSVESRAQQGFYGAAFVHGFVAFGDLGEGQGEVEDFAGVDGSVQYEFDEVRQIAADGRGAAVEVDVGEEKLLAVELDFVGDPDEGDVAAAPRGLDGLQH